MLLIEMFNVLNVPIMKVSSSSGKLNKTHLILIFLKLLKLVKKALTNLILAHFQNNLVLVHIRASVRTETDILTNGHTDGQESMCMCYFWLPALLKFFQV